MNNFKWFFTEYEYPWPIILRATKKYVTEFSDVGYKYMRTSQFFIKKQDKNGVNTSDLASYCYLIETGHVDIMDKSNFKDKFD